MPKAYGVTRKESLAVAQSVNELYSERREVEMASRTHKILNWIVVVLFCSAATAATQKTAVAKTYAVRVVRDVPYLQGARYADDKDKLDIYLPENRRNAPVIVSYYG